MRASGLLSSLFLCWAAHATTLSGESTRPFSGQIRLEAGTYTLCPTSVPDDRCRRLDVHSSSDQQWDFSPESSRGHQYAHANTLAVRIAASPRRMR